jgi:uncharacterized protein YeeX (DUF496 family)
MERINAKRKGRYILSEGRYYVDVDYDKHKLEYELEEQNAKVRNNQKWLYLAIMCYGLAIFLNLIALIIK